MRLWALTHSLQFFMTTQSKQPYSTNMSKQTKSNRLMQLTNDIVKHANGGDINEMMVDWTKTKLAKEHAPALHCHETANTVLNNSINLVNSMPKQAHFRQPLISNLFKGVSNSEISKICNVSQQLASSSKRNTNLNECFNTRYGTKLHRNSVSLKEKSAIKEAIEDCCPTVSGRNFRKQFISDEELYSKYVEFMEEHYTEMTIRSEKYVINFKRDMKIRRERSYYGHFECEKCREYKKNIKQRDDLMQNFLEPRDRGKLNGILKDIAAAEMHMRVGPIQRDLFRMQRNNLDSSQILIVQDFTRHYPDSKDLKSPIVDMVVVLISRDINDVEQIQNLHIMSSVHRNNHQFVANAWYRVIYSLIPQYHRYTIWSDGSGKEFKNMYIQAFYSWLQQVTGKEFEYNFYVSNHAHNIADGVAGSAKKVIKQDEIEGFSNPQTTDEFIEVMMRKCSMTIAIELKECEEPIYGELKAKWPRGIKKFHSIRYDGYCQILTRETTSMNSEDYSGDSCVKQVLIRQQ